MTIEITHYHDHAKMCKQCGKAQEHFDMFAFLGGDETQVEKIFKESCEQGKDMFMGFLLALVVQQGPAWME